MFEGLLCVGMVILLAIPLLTCTDLVQMRKCCACGHRFLIFLGREDAFCSISCRDETFKSIYWEEEDQYDYPGEPTVGRCAHCREPLPQEMVAVDWRDAGLCANCSPSGMRLLHQG